MDKSPIEVMTIDSESEDDELQIVSENITNYGNYSKPVDISPELKQKIVQSLQKSGHPVNINAIKIFASKTNNNEKGTVRAILNSGDGLSQVINVGPVFKENFVKSVQGEINNNVDPLAVNSKKSKGEKRTKYIPKSNNPKPPFPSSSATIFKGKQSHRIRKNTLKKKTTTNMQLKKFKPQNPTSHETISSFPDFSLDFDNTLGSINIKEDTQNSSFIFLNNNNFDSQKSTSSPPNVMDTSDPLSLDSNDNGFEEASSNVSQKVNSVEFPQNEFARDGDEIFENSREIVCDENGGPFKNSHSSKLLPQKSLDTMLELGKGLVECGQELKDQETYKFSKQIMSNNLKESFRHENKNGIPPLWSTIFPPSPPSPPPPVWHDSTHLWQLEPLQFQGVTGLCRNEAAAEMRRLQAAPKPVARVLRQKPKKKQVE